MALDVPEKRRYRMDARAVATAATRDRILDAAWQRFADSPFDDVRLADIAATAGVSVPTVHSRVGGKEQLFVAAWRRHMEPEGVRRDAAKPGDVRGAVRVLYASYERD